MPDRYVVIVPRSAPETFAYLSRSFKDIPDVEIVVDRRLTTGPAPPPTPERRTSNRDRMREAFGCTLVRLTASAETPPPPVAPSAEPAPAVEVAPPRPAPERDSAVQFRALRELRGV